MLALLPCVVAFALSALSVFAIQPLLQRRNVIDTPNERSSHASPVLRGGGLGVLVGLLAGLAVAAVLLSLAAPPAAIAGVVAAAAAVGWYEDSRGLSPRVRLILQTIVGALGSALVVVVFEGPWFLWIPGAIGIVVGINVANFMDGVNGISGAHGIVFGVAFAVIGAMTDNSLLTLSGMVLAAAFAGFLPWNLLGNGLFLGDVGSYVLGSAGAVLALCTAASGVPILAVAGPFVVYLVDTGVTLVRRILRRESWLEAHRSHMYQRLTDHGLSHVQVAAVTAVASAMTAALGIASIDASFLETLLLGGAMVLVAVAYSALVVFARRVHRRTKGA